MVTGMRTLHVRESTLKNYAYGTKDELISALSKINCDFFLSNGISLIDNIIFGTSNLIITSKDDDLVVFYDNIIIGNGLKINPTRYKENPDKYEDIIIKTIELNKNESFSIDENLILTDNIITALVNNPNIKHLNLKKRRLDKELYKKLIENKHLSIDCTNLDPELEEIYDGTIINNMRKELIKGFTVSSLINAMEFTFDRKYSEEELKILKEHLKNVRKLYFTNDGVNNSLEIIEFFNNLDLKLIYKLDSSMIYDINILKKVALKYPDAIINYDYTEGNILDYIEFNSKIDKLLEPIKGLELSPLEKFIFVFNVAKRIKKYRENTEDLDAARSIFTLLKDDNEYIVCVGFSIILKELCKRINIPCDKIGTDIITVSNDNTISTDRHARVITRINDSKYGLDNIYISDPTWNNKFKFDLINTALMTPLETNYFDSWISDCEYDILLSESYEEFLHRIYVKYSKNNLYKFDKILDILMKLYPEFKIECEKFEAYKEYEQAKSVKPELTKKLLTDENFMMMLYNFISIKCNHVIEGNVLITAAVNLYKKLNPHISEEELKIYEEKLIADNYYAYNQHFPVMTAHHNDDSLEILANAQNKFVQGPRQI